MHAEKKGVMREPPLSEREETLAKTLGLFQESGPSFAQGS
jgi:hypothetical protein